MVVASQKGYVTHVVMCDRNDDTDLVKQPPDTAASGHGTNLRRAAVMTALTNGNRINGLTADWRAVAEATVGPAFWRNGIGDSYEPRRRSSSLTFDTYSRAPRSQIGTTASTLAAEPSTGGSTLQFNSQSTRRFAIDDNRPRAITNILQESNHLSTTRRSRRSQLLLYQYPHVSGPDTRICGPCATQIPSPGPCPSSGGSFLIHGNLALARLPPVGHRPSLIHDFVARVTTTLLLHDA
ncbi:hypothetical protein VDGL01_11936 [Verticillium dahliae]